MEDFQKESPFIIKNEKYSIDIILKYQTPNGISHKGITIYKKNYEINFLNEESLDSSINNIKKERNNEFINSFANIGFISISDIICFLYLTKNDIILLNNTEEYIFYKIKNLHYIKMIETNNLIGEEEDKNFKNNFEQFKIFFVSENLFFSFSKYGNNILNHHIDASNNYCYNEKYFTLFKQSNSIEFITPLIKGIYNHLIIKENKDSKNNNKNKNNITNQNNNNNYLEIDIIIKSKTNRIESNFIKIEDILNDKECPQEIEIDIYSNIINKKINYQFYAYYGKSCSDIDYLYSLFKDRKDIIKGLILTAFDYGYNKETDKKEDNSVDNSKKSNNNEINKDKFDIMITNDNRKDNIKKFVYKNIDKIKYIFEKEEQENNKEKNINDKLLILSGSSENSIFNLTQEIIHSIIHFFFNSFLNKDNNENDILLGKTKSNIDNFFNILDELYGIRTMKLFKLKFPKVCYVDKKYIEEYLKTTINISSKINISKNENENNEYINKSKTNFSIFILTYNVCGMNIESINSINFSELLFPEKVKIYYESHKNVKNNYPIFYCIGLEEVINLNAKNVIIGGEKEKYELWEKKITYELKSKNNYVLLVKTRLVGILFFLFVQASEVSKIINIKNSRTKTGFYGQLGNKGSCFVEFQYENKRYGFNNGHLAAGENIKNNNERKNNLLNILNHKSYNDSNEFSKNDFYFILGDLNFRVKNNIKIIHNWLFNLKFEGKQYIKENINKNNNINNNNINNIKNDESNKASFFTSSEVIKEDEDNENIENIFFQIDEKIFMKYFGDDYLKFDQLNIFKEELTKYNIKESNILFPPTYKYIKKSNNYNLLKREPSWTDRILFKENSFIKCIIYDRINLHYSDHKPVFSLLQINY